MFNRKTDRTTPRISRTVWMGTDTHVRVVPACGGSMPRTLATIGSSSAVRATSGDDSTSNRNASTSTGDFSCTVGTSVVNGISGPRDGDEDDDDDVLFADQRNNCRYNVLMILLVFTSFVFVVVAVVVRTPSTSLFVVVVVEWNRKDDDDDDDDDDDTIRSYGSPLPYREITCEPYPVLIRKETTAFDDIR